MKKGEKGDKDMTPGGVSLRPSDFVEGGAVPVDQNLTWKECRFDVWDYQGKRLDPKTGKPVITTAARITYVNDDGQEFVQQYSVGDPERFIPSEDGKMLIAVARTPAGTALAVSKSSNFYLLLNALVNAGFPENRLFDDISTLDGLVTYNIGLPEPKRPGLARQAEEGAREKILSVPSQIIQLPWEKGKGKGKTAPARAAATVPAASSTQSEGDDGSAIAEKTLKFLGEHLDGKGETTRLKLASAMFKELAKDPDRDAVAKLVYTPEFQAILLAGGYALDGEVIKKTQ